MFSPIKTTKVYEQVIKQIEQMIISGELKRGQKLPSERDLSEQLQVSRASVREAFRALEIIGLIHVRQGEGSYIKESFEEFLFQPLTLLFTLQQSNPQEIIELRRIIELEAAYLAAKRCTDEEIEQLRSLVVELIEADKINDTIRSEIADQKFHYSIAKASKNLLLLNILHLSSGLIDISVQEARGKITTTVEKKDLVSSQHFRIYEAIKNKEPLTAKACMKEHIDFIEEQYLKNF